MARLFSGVLILLLFTFGLGLSAPIEREPSVMDEVVAVVNAVKDEFPAIRNADVQVGDLAENIYAVTRATIGNPHFSGRITINRIFATDRRRMQASTDYDVSLGFHPTLGHCTAAQFIAYHEAAHLVDASEDTASHNALFNRFGDGHQLYGILSGYSFYQVNNPLAPGLINAPEALAEAFAAVHCNGGNWAEKELNNMLTLLGEIHELRN